MNGFSAADMSTAAASAHHDGYQAGYSDAVKAVAVSEMETTTGIAQEAFVCTGDEIRCHDGNGCECAMRGLKPAAAQEAVALIENARAATDFSTNYATAKPDIGSTEKEHILGLCRVVNGLISHIEAAPGAAAPVVDASTLRALSDRWANDRSYTGSPVDDIRALIEQPTASTPAAPGIDLPRWISVKDRLPTAADYEEEGGDVLVVFRYTDTERTSRTQWQVSESNHDQDHDLNGGWSFGSCDYAKVSHWMPKRALLALIDASPKGGVIVTGAMVEAAAIVVAGSKDEWDSYTDEVRDGLREIQRAALTAAMQATSPKGGSDAEPLFYIQDTRSFVGNCPVWWGPNGNGYVTRLDEAGWFTEQEAIAQNRTRDTDVPWPCAEINKLGRITVDAQHMRPRSERLAELQATSAEVGA